MVTLGEKGSIWINSKSCIRFKVPKQKAIDSTAAGDVFNGYLAYGITRGFSIRESILISHAAATISVTVKGAQPSIPTIKKVQFFLEKNQITEEIVSV